MSHHNDEHQECEYDQTEDGSECPCDRFQVKTLPLVLLREVSLRSGDDGEVLGGDGLHLPLQLLVAQTLGLAQIIVDDSLFGDYILKDNDGIGEGHVIEAVVPLVLLLELCFLYHVLSPHLGQLQISALQILNVHSLVLGLDFTLYLFYSDLLQQLHVGFEVKVGSCEVPDKGDFLDLSILLLNPHHNVLIVVRLQSYPLHIHSIVLYGFLK